MGNELYARVYQTACDILREDVIDRDYQSMLRLVVSSFFDSPRFKRHLLDLPWLACRAAGGGGEGAWVVSTAWSLNYLAFELLDSIEDDDKTHPTLAEYGVGVTLNLSTGLLMAAGRTLQKLENIPLPIGWAACIQEMFQRKLLRVGCGQHQDLTLKERRLRQGWQIAEKKTGTFFDLVCSAGAMLASDDPETINLFSDYGLSLGLLIQIGDDLTDLSENQYNRSDLSCGKQSLPVAYALSVMPEDQVKKLRMVLISAVVDSGARSEARKMIVESGAVLYLILEAARIVESTRAQLLRNLPDSDARTQLIEILESLSCKSQVLFESAR